MAREGGGGRSGVLLGGDRLAGVVPVEEQRVAVVEGPLVELAEGAEVRAGAHRVQPNGPDAVRAARGGEECGDQGGRGGRDEPVADEESALVALPDRQALGVGGERTEPALRDVRAHLAELLHGRDGRPADRGADVDLDAVVAGAQTLDLARDRLDHEGAEQVGAHQLVPVREVHERTGEGLLVAAERHLVQLAEPGERGRGDVHLADVGGKDHEGVLSSR